MTHRLVYYDGKRPQAHVENLVVDTDTGNVGIGTQTPIAKLHVEGNIYVTSNVNTTDRLAFRQTRYGLDASYKVLQYGNCAARSSISLGYDPIGNGNELFTGNEILIPYNKAIIAPTSDDNGYVGILRLASSNVLQIGGSNFTTAGHIKIDQASGNVGIGGLPTTKLDVNGNIQTNSKLIVSQRGSEGISMGVWTSIGEEDAHNALLIGNNATVDGSTSVVRSSTADGYRAIKMKYDEGISFHANNSSVNAGDSLTSERMRIDPTGNVGIGTSNPSSNLHVEGTAQMSNIIVDSTNGDRTYPPGTGTLTIDLDNMSYKTFDLTTSVNMSNLVVNNDILGSQGIVFIYTESGMDINDVSNVTSNILTGYSSIALSSGERAVMTICSDGTRKYVNCVKYT